MITAEACEKVPEPHGCPRRSMIATVVLRLRMDAESVHGESDHERVRRRERPAAPTPNHRQPDDPVATTSALACRKDAFIGRDCPHCAGSLTKFRMSPSFADAAARPTALDEPKITARGKGQLELPRASAAPSSTP